MWGKKGLSRERCCRLCSNLELHFFPALLFFFALGLDRPRRVCHHVRGEARGGVSRRGEVRGGKGNAESLSSRLVVVVVVGVTRPTIPADGWGLRG